MTKEIEGKSGLGLLTFHHLPFLVNRSGVKRPSDSGGCFSHCSPHTHTLSRCVLSVEHREVSIRPNTKHRHTKTFSDALCLVPMQKNGVCHYYQFRGISKTCTLWFSIQTAVVLRCCFVTTTGYPLTAQKDNRVLYLAKMCEKCMRNEKYNRFESVVTFQKSKSLFTEAQD